MAIEDTVAAYVEAAGEFSHVVSSAMLRMARELTELHEQVENISDRLAIAEQTLRESSG